MQTLAEADWTRQPLGYERSPLVLFLRLGLTDKDGWVQPENFADIPAAAKKWLAGHADSYRLQRFVSARADKTP